MFFKNYINKLIGRYSYNTQRGLRILYGNRKDINYFKTIYFNFKALPFNKAKYLPFVIGKNVKIRSIGNIILDGEVAPAIISLGCLYINAWEDNKESTLIFNNQGTVSFMGRAKFYPGSKLFVKGNITFGGDNNIGSRTLIICYNNIIWGNYTGCSWDCNIIDTNFHPLKDTVADRYLKQDGKITIGNHVFIGNHVYVAMNSKIPDGAIVSSWSKVSGSYAKSGETPLISTDSAKVVGNGFIMEDYCQF